MESLELSYCGLEGELPSSLGKLKSLQLLYLSGNSFWGSIPESIFSDLSSSLKTLYLSDNLFNGSIPESLGQLSQLVRLSLSSNSWEGSLREAHFINLTRLKYIGLTTERPVPIIFNLTDYEWIPPFKLGSLFMDNCRVGPGFPVWLQSQTELSYVQVTNAGISGAIPEEWMSNISSQIESLDLSYNQISRKLPLQFNFPDLKYIYFSHNHLDGTIPSSICSIQSLYSLSLNNNKFSGEFPKEWSSWSRITFVDVSNNNLSGEIPSSMGIPSSLFILKMDNNQLSGEIPSAFQNCSFLQRLSLGGNKFIGSIPSWIGSKVSRFKVLQLRSNSLSGHIPHQLCSLPLLQFLDLGHNRFSGTIPKCLNNLTALVSGPDGWGIFSDFEETTVTTKGRESEYFTRQAMLLTIIDLSSNDLEGEIPEEISSLVSLGTLNLSMNQLSGGIPSKIGNLYRLETLDLSQNRLSGHIPQSLSNMTFLSHLNLSHNKLTGRIPSGNQLQTLVDPSIYEGNSLCGFPLPKCPEDEDNMHEPDVQEKKDHGDDEEKLGFYTSAVLGFIVGFWSVCGTLILKKSWRYAYFQFFDHIKDKVTLSIALRAARLQRRS
uniref:leucine-rich repeat receptor protein kinase EXS-like n=1 Tax=Fragaria vesca subsp. vesca TaxID=101020 RepID=UPI0005CAAA54|nr:PREDICTED: leucine-rich repeat receptor protein kinase EXS-like [Fragaria vesca subsp. vesca]